MIRALLLALYGSAAVLAAVVATEFRQPAPVPAIDVGAFALPVPAAPAAAAASWANAVQLQSWVATILARPLFTRDRRPAEAPAAAAAVPDSLPRLTGITVSPAGRHAIFASPGGKPLVTSTGDHVAGFTVRAIEPGGVTLVGPGGSRVLQPAFKEAPRAASVGSPASPASGMALELPAGFSPEGRPVLRGHFPEAPFNRVAQRPFSAP